MHEDDRELMDYTWEFFGLHSVWTRLETLGNGDSDTYSQILLCFDFAEDVQCQTIQAFEATDADQIAPGPFGVYEVFLELLTRRYDDAVWGFRSPMRAYENRRLSPGERDSKKLTKRYINMHEFERHIIHAKETLDVASRTVRTMARDHEKYILSIDSRRKALLEAEENTQRSLHSFAELLTNLRSRAKAFEERLQNEIRLVFNTVEVQEMKQSTSQLDELKRTAKDLESLRGQNQSLSTTVSLLTLIFLPGSFISSFFGTNFFTITPNGSASPHLSFVRELWIFFAVTVPVTVLALAIWYYSTRKYHKPESEIRYEMNSYDGINM
ncbi:MAG: hypothetical protein Q9157_004128 [Trypethelium eluteriae]